DKMFLRRKKPFSTYTIEDTGAEETVWTTFGKTDPSEQVDLDIYSQDVRQLFKEFFENFSKNNIKIVRLDAVGYIIKKLGTSCFFIEPEIYEFLDWVKRLSESYHIELLPEVHSHYSIQYRLSEHGFWIYDFILPYTDLNTIVKKRSVNLYLYLKVRPEKQFTMLDCLDGIAVKPDMDNLVDTDEARELVDLCVERGANLSLVLSEELQDEDGFDV